MYEIKNDPELSDIASELTYLAQNIDRLQRLIGGYKKKAAERKTELARAEARAYILNRGEKNAGLIKARVVLDNDVITQQNLYDSADATLQIANGELAGFDAKFTAVRKQAELKKMEMQMLNVER